MRSCKTCDFSFAIATPRSVDDPRQFDCRRFPPQAVDTAVGVSTVWPIVEEDEWCGEWKSCAT